MNDDVQEASIESVLTAADASRALAPGGPDESPSVCYRLSLKDGHISLARALDMNGSAEAIIDKLLFLDASEVWTSVQSATAASLNS